MSAVPNQTSRKIRIPWRGEKWSFEQAPDGRFHLYDYEGEPVFALSQDPGDSLLLEIINLQYKAHLQGAKAGAKARSREIRLLLEDGNE